MTIKNYQTIFDTVYHSGNPDAAKGFCGWQRKAQITRGALLKVKEKIASDLKELRETYNEKTVQSLYADMMSDYGTIKAAAEKRLLTGLDEIVAEKRKQYRKIALTAPTDEQLRLLQALALRDDLTENEVTAIAESMGDNLQALRSLGSIARKNGLDFPSYGTVDEFENALADAEQYCKETLYDLDADELGYFAKCFYDYEGIGLPAIKFRPLDEPLFAAVQKPQEPTENAESEPAT